jgi:hypothetical protein
LRRLEHAILERLFEIDPKHQVLYAESKISIEHFYGLEIDDFAVEVAILSLWIAKHQMNAEFKEKFNLSIPLIPLKETGQIQAGNATRVAWNSLCPNDGTEEIYLIGNPPYKGGKSQNKEMKEDYPFVFGNRPYSKDLDYIALWFVKGADYIEGTRAELAFTNLIAEPDATQGEVKVSVNNMLKAITASLLMEQVLAQNFTFKTKKFDGDDSKIPGQLKIKGFKEPSTERVRQIVETDLNDLKATILQDDTFARAAAGSIDAETANKVLIPKIIREKYPDLTDSQVEEVRQQVVVDSVVKNGEVREVGDKRFIKMAEKFVNIDELTINLIDSVNPFQRAFEVMSKSVTPSVLRIIQDQITATRVEFTEEEALALVPRIKNWIKVNGRRPDSRAEEPTEKRYADALLWLQRAKQKLEAQKRATEMVTDE